jgi:putative effector of murein hydrolase LrgA (UPF0299 family)
MSVSGQIKKGCTSLRSLLFSAMQHTALKELNVNIPQSVWGLVVLYGCSALKELNMRIMENIFHQL